MRHAGVAVTLAGMALSGLFLLAARAHDAPKEKPVLNTTTLMQKALAKEFTEGREVIVDLVEMPPNTTLDRHWHPGEEFHYYLEGEVEVRIDGEPTIVGKPGTVGHVPFRKLHTAVSGKEGAKILVVRVHTSGQPVRYLEKEASGGH
jgi:quercetin dioxygenase-like cupin family protein